MRTRCIQHISLFIAAIALFIAADGLQAHKPVTSKFTYYENIQPLFRFYCGGCHVSKGIAPMSLLTYKEAYPWAESIKDSYWPIVCIPGMMMKASGYLPRASV